MKYTFTLLGMLLLASVSFSEIIYTDITDVTVSPTDESKLDIDINQDGTKDFTIKVDGDDVIIRGDFSFVDASSSNIQPFSKSDTINSTKGFVNGGDLIIQGKDNANFPLGEDKFIGVSLVNFPTQGDQVFGWIHVRVDGSNEVRIFDFAIEDVSGASILAGQKSANEFVGISVQKVDLNITVYPNPTSDVIHIQRANDDSEIDEIVIMSQNGRLISSYAGSTEIIKVSNYAPGSYFLIIKKRNSAVLTERIVIR